MILLTVKICIELNNNNNNQNKFEFFELIQPTKR